MTPILADSDFLEVLKFLYSDFWHWLGTVILVLAVCQTLYSFGIWLRRK